MLCGSLTAVFGITAFMHPELDPLKAGYQINQSLMAMGTGGLFGRGLGEGKQKVPTKGLALPFISYGGSSLVISLFAVGILLNISSRRI